jgi:hypothetical protein
MKVRLCATLGLMVAGVLGCSENVGVSATESELHSGGSIECSHHEVAMCHHSHHHGNRTICVDPWEVPRHLHDGDTLGPCEEPPECPPQVECGDGTTLVNGECVSTISCGPGTVLTGVQCLPVPPPPPITCATGTVFDPAGNQCLPGPAVTCATGTVFDPAGNQGLPVPPPPAVTCATGTVFDPVGNQCLPVPPPPAVTCGDGTRFDPAGNQCVVANPFVCGTGTIGAGGVCSPDYASICAPGTVLLNGQCVGDTGFFCGPNTVVQNGKCVPSLPSICGSGTVAQGGQCVASNPLTCGPGTEAQNGQCVPTNPLTCGPGTVQAGNGQCLPDLGTICGVGTVAQGGQCVPAGDGTCDAGHVSVCECADGDDDHDGVCNEADACLGYDDRIDSDGDGFPDGCDTDIDAFEPNDVTPFLLQYSPTQVFPTLSGVSDLDKFSFAVDGGHMIVIQACASLSDSNIAPPMVEVRLGDQVVYSNANNTTSGCPTPIFIPAATRGTYVLTLQQWPFWQINRLIYQLFLQIT